MKYFLALVFVFVISTKALKIDRRSYADNQSRSAEFEFARRLNKIAKLVDRTEWFGWRTTVGSSVIIRNTGRCRSPSSIKALLRNSQNVTDKMRTSSAATYFGAKKPAASY